MNRTIITYVLLFMVIIGLNAQTSPEKEAELTKLFTKGSELLYVNKDSTYYYFQAAEKLALELDDKNTLLDILSYWIFASDYHYDLPTYRYNLKKTEAFLKSESFKAEVQDYVIYQNLFLLDEATYYYKTMENGLALSNLRQLLSKLEAIPIDELDEQNASSLYSTYNYLASLHTRIGNYELAEQFYQKALVFLEKNGSTFNNPEDYITGTHQLMAQLYSLTGDYQKAEKLLLKTLEATKNKYSRHTAYKNSLMTAHLALSKNYIAMDSLNKALEYLNKSQTLLVDKDPFYKKSELAYGNLYSRMGEVQKAYESYTKALEAFRQYRQNRPHQDVADVHGKIAELYLKQKIFPKGLASIQKAFNVSGNNIRIINFGQNPDPEAVFSKTQLLELLDVKLQLLQGIYAEKEDVAGRDVMLKTSGDILKTFDLLKSEFDSKVDKEFLAEKAYPIFHRMMEAVHTIYKNDRSPKTLQLALNIAEKNKDFVLLEALRSAQANQYGNVPTNVLEKEAQLRFEIANLEKQLFNATETDTGFSESLFKRKQEYFDFLDTIKSQYPKYHKLKYQNRTLNLATVRKKLLDNNGTLISYTMADDYLFAIIINGSNEDFLKLPFTESNRDAIRTFYRLLSSASINGVDKKIYNLANSLFGNVLEEPLANFDTKNLTIIPDGELHYLPFDLLQEKGAYLLETKSIGYGNSVASLLELKEKPSAKTNNVLAFAPSFSGVVTTSLDRQFGKLLYNDDEVQKLEAFFDSETLLKEEATLLNFKTNSSRFNIFHLATHASANDEYPDYSYLAFTDTKDGTQSNILYIKDLYNMTFPADMVTLSACQTGIGKLQKGQGMMSLSKGFYYAGAKSLVTTLWKINDKSTVKLMEYFYEELSEGKSKTEALRQAKLKYLASTDDDLLKHPYYWAAFVVSGDVSPISNSNTLWWVVGAGLFSLLIFFIFSKKEKDFRKRDFTTK